MTLSKTRAWRKLNPTALFFLILGLASGLALWRLGDHGLRMWDETRYAENAWQMLQRGDFLNYYFDDQMDDWVAKPPLGMWLIALAYKVIGFNEWALRLPSALAGISAILITFALVRLYKGAISAALVCLALITCRGILGPHVSRSGDLDALYVATAMGVIYFMARYSSRHDRRALLLAAACAGLCFFSKGFMLLLFLPGLGLYLLLRGRVLPLLRDPYFWGGVLILGLFIGGWYQAVHGYGNRFPNSIYGSDAWDVMVNYDIRRRFTEKLEGDKTTPTFVFEALDTRFSPWLYLFYVSLLALLIRGRGRLKPLWTRLRHDDLLSLSICMTGATCIVLANSATKFNWYFAITTPFLAVMTLQLMRWMARSVPYVWGLYALCAAIGLGMQAYTVAKKEDGLTDAVIQNWPLLRDAKHIYATRAPNFNTRLALKWRQKTLAGTPPEGVSSSLTLLQPKLGVIKESEGYSVLLLPGSLD